jgi:DNA helicase-2/ATP-dependent DNA helicase PcrA
VKGNPRQIEAIEALDGPLLIIAGPGSGKTFTLVERTVHLLSTREVDPRTALISTFTEKAARELQTRIAGRLEPEGLDISLAEMAVGTLHSIFLKILDEYRAFTNIHRNYTVLDQFDQQYFLYQRMREFEDIDGLSDALFPNKRLSGWWSFISTYPVIGIYG